MAERLALPGKILALDDALGPIPHAFGGALALAYYAEPRATVDIDVNVFAPEAEAAGALDALRPLGIAVDRRAVKAATTDGQVRVYWDDNPVDLFFSYDRFHDAAERAVVRVPFSDTVIPILAADHLVVCKVVFNRPQDWVDIDAIRQAGTALDPAEILRWVARIVGDEDARYERIVAVLAT